MAINKKQIDKKYIWTNHILQKMWFYRLTESRIKKVLRSPKRTEEGIALETTASMQASGSKKRKEEIWVMWQIKKEKGRNKTILISAWRYPGESPIGKKIIIPNDVLEDLRSSGLIS